MFSKNELQLIEVAGKSKSFMIYEKKRFEESEQIRETYTQLIKQGKATKAMMDDAIRKADALLLQQYSPLFSKEFSYEYRKILLEDELPQLNDETRDFILSLPEEDWNKLVTNYNNNVLTEEQRKEIEEDDQIFRNKIIAANKLIEIASKQEDIIGNKENDKKSSLKISEKEMLDIKNSLGYDLKDLANMNEDQMNYFLKKNKNLIDGMLNEGMGKDTEEILNSSDFKNFVKMMKSKSPDALTNLPGLDELKKSTAEFEAMSTMATGKDANEILNEFIESPNKNVDIDYNNMIDKKEEIKKEDNKNLEWDVKQEAEFNTIRDQMLNYYKKKVYNKNIL